MWSARGIIIILLVLLSIHSLNVSAQADCQACLQVDASLSPCNTSLKRPNPGETVIVQFGALEAKCYCNQATYDQLGACSACNNGNIKVDDLGRYKDVCATFGVPFTGGSPGKEQPTTPTNNPTDASNDPQININIPNYSNSSTSLSSYIILGVVLGIPALIILGIFMYKCCFKRRQSLKIKNVSDRSASQVDLTDDSSIISRLQVYQQQHSQTQSQTQSPTQSIENDDLTEISIENGRVNNNEMQQQYNFRKNY
ncbi:hypothetical protein RhiirA5_422860 [Rhizophagus irregularis]|uniref:Mid2 domain-containing protein n=4 Tax=Rhizophagus irregularis TaxID=588596 RepID=A0A2I1E3N1_9GLOM|nr:hypothetical protein GLOIN_2v1587545 [Rhizophagus irregularis DAOM 181602=DAOM 197198]EXX51729.1 hypothetical protein RirG_259130 [Rhizophagus irregularis DAOM 197198w]PKC04022.1 hypothetical protein RhiirA5_422860 [Rhizophagus irregularis]PKC76464.1 hypothetical protein RhiirA1_447643 [Rhizophagus irregularis]PKY16726.1 hypothetical protein RhiirB3_429188 [Rhizophagus irregularis]PKY42124.1 hypothetical protein RhiirA4_455859 [Rhizophagus irregularis]|eukprot:XP_025180096.1 hypothetical protein GLOIN_2v1587545 [Rhizophagus irregularis DAOM 181602=DAOM 197198]